MSTLVAYNAACVQGNAACKGNAPVNVKKKYVLCNAIKRGHGYEYLYVCVIIKQISSRQLLVCVCVCVCNRNAPGSAIKEAPRDVCVCVCVCLCTRKIKDRHGCVYVCHHYSPVDSFCVCVWMYMHANTAERLWLHNAVILLLIMKYFVLKWYRIPIQLHHATFSVAHAKKMSSAFTWYANYHPTVNNKG